LLFSCSSLALLLLFSCSSLALLLLFSYSSFKIRTLWLSMKATFIPLSHSGSGLDDLNVSASFQDRNEALWNCSTKPTPFC
jgi:hypothetical protein